MMLKVFLDDNLGFMAYDRKKEQEKGIHMTPTAMMPSISMLALPECGNVFVLGADTSRVGIGVTLMQGSLPADLGGSTARTLGYDTRIVYLPTWVTQPPEHLGTGGLLTSPGRVNR
ncbi:hypothetical protein B296_00040726 [Ensete ventricosum]|uniref:Uncharacterized protein n=1 Tax=Ensete ventricosum TaxID=4639 RepID=A0A426XNV0_ENSVE|nr:hypothetical protein B296_00040726 [Ensete ventricosum]